MAKVSQLSNEEQIFLVERLATVLRKGNGTSASVKDAFAGLFDEDISDLEDTLEIRICDECGKIMVEGYCIDGGNEHFCSPTCLNVNYTHEEFMALCAGLDPNDEDDLEKLRGMTDGEFHEMAEDSDTYYTTWEI